MAPFAYRIRRPISEVCRGALNQELLESLNLGHLKIQKPGSDCFISQTRDGGTYIAFDRSIEQQLMDYTWLDAGDVSIGWMVKRKPSPTDLARPDLIPGLTITDRSDAQWQCPVINADSDGCTLPRALTYQAGKPARVFLTKHNNIRELGRQLIDEATQMDVLTETWILESSIKLLSINYRISALEIEAFSSMDHHVFDQASAMALILHALDLFDQPTV